MNCARPARAVAFAFALAIASVGWPVPTAAEPTAGKAYANGPALQTWSLRARLIATGMHRAFGIRQVGRFHSGGPLTSNPEFLLQTQAGRALDPKRLLVAVDQNFGARLGNTSHAPGAVISIDPTAATTEQPIAVPSDLGSRPSTAGAAVQLYSVQSARYLNREHNSGANTADFAGVSGPRYLSINNAFGRPWVANAPFGVRGAGSESVLDPDGAPLANAPSDGAGGVFAGAQNTRTSRPRAVRTGWIASLMNREESGQLTRGSIDHGALGTALLGSSPDGSGFAVFAVVTGSGAVVQVHVQDGVDGLAPAGTIDVGGDDPGVIGIAFKWNADRSLFVADARRNRIAVLHLSDDERHFTLARTSYLESAWLKRPVDLAACIPEIANPRFASHTTLAGGSDFYVVNRGDGSLLRVRQDGTVVARASIAWPDGSPVGGDRLRSIAVSADAQRIWLIAQRDAGPEGGESVLMETNGFDANGAFVSGANEALKPASAESARDGARLFATVFTANTGLGPLFNATSCATCHPGQGGASPLEEHFARRVARMDPGSGRVVVSNDRLGSLSPRHSTAASVAATEPLPREANVVSLRMPLSLSVAGRLDEIPDAAIEAQAVSKGDGIKGRVHYVAAADGARRVGRYGWKADVARLDEMVAEAMGNEMGVTSALAVRPAPTVKDDGSMVRALSAYLRALSTALPSSVSAPPTSKRHYEARR
ncbi:MAG: di-heme oxidoredictase family protein [Caldimonas sp.]